jgi:beta-N-acetylhexosaminidase
MTLWPAGGRHRANARRHREEIRTPPEPDESPGAVVGGGIVGLAMLMAAALWPGDADVSARGPSAAGRTRAPLLPLAEAAPASETSEPPAQAPATQAEESPEPAPTSPSPDLAVECEPLGLRERVAQTIMASIPGTSISTEARRTVRMYAGSVLLYGRNIAGATQLARLTRELHDAAPDLLVAVDEEGGRVSRLGEKGIVPVFSSARTLGSTATPQEVRDIGARLGRQMRDLGIDWNLAPVLDVTDAPSGTVIGDRSYAATPEAAGELGRAFAEGLASAGILSTGKHFPGEGGTTVDPHQTLPTVSVSLETLLERDVAAFREAASSLDAVMGAHVVYSALDPDRPATVSPSAARLLRREVGFDGVLMTDALEMAAIARRWTIPEAAELAIAAGYDVALVGHPDEVDDTWRRLRDAVRSGEIGRARIDEAAARVLAMKGRSPAEIDCLLS